MTSVNLIVGHSFYIDKNKNGYGIGLNNKLPWNIKEDLQNFKKVTTLVPQDENIEYMNDTNIINYYNEKKQNIFYNKYIEDELYWNSVKCKLYKKNCESF